MSDSMVFLCCAFCSPCEVMVLVGCEKACFVCSWTRFIVFCPLGLELTGPKQDKAFVDLDLLRSRK